MSPTKLSGFVLLIWFGLAANLADADIIVFDAEIGNQNVNTRFSLMNSPDALNNTFLRGNTNTDQSNNGDVPTSVGETVAYGLNFDVPGVYDLYARVSIESGDHGLSHLPENHDSFIVSNGFGDMQVGQPNDWIGAKSFFFGDVSIKDDVDGNPHVVDTFAWSKITGMGSEGITVPSYTAEAGLNIFKIATREHGFRFDAFAFSLQANGDLDTIGLNQAYLDDGNDDIIALPEPSVYVVLSSIGIWFGVRRRRRRMMRP